MKMTRWILVTALIGCFQFTSRGQLLTLTGAVTNVTGIYDATVSIGDAVVFTIDFSRSPEFGHSSPFPGTVRYNATAALTVGGQSYDIVERGFQRNIGVLFSDLSSSFGNGIRPNIGWGNGGRGMSTVIQYLTSPNDIGSTLDYFPPDVPISEFTNRSGGYSIFDFLPNGDLSLRGLVEWEISAYSGFAYIPPYVVPVPESTTYSIVAGLGVVGLMLRRRWLACRVSNAAA